MRGEKGKCLPCASRVSKVQLSRVAKASSSSAAARPSPSSLLLCPPLPANPPAEPTHLPRTVALR